MFTQQLMSSSLPNHHLNIPSKSWLICLRCAIHWLLRCNSIQFTKQKSILVVFREYTLRHQNIHFEVSCPLLLLRSIPFFTITSHESFFLSLSSFQSNLSYFGRLVSQQKRKKKRNEVFDMAISLKDGTSSFVTKRERIRNTKAVNNVYLCLVGSFCRVLKRAEGLF